MHFSSFNPAFSQKIFGNNLKLPETLRTISRYDVRPKLEICILRNDRRIGSANENHDNSANFKDKVKTFPLMVTDGKFIDIAKFVAYKSLSSC